MRLSLTQRDGATSGASRILIAACIVITAIAFTAELERWPGALKAGEVPAQTSHVQIGRAHV